MATHDFTHEIEAAFANYETTRKGKVALPPPSFLYGPYFSPSVEIGQEVECALNGSVRVVGWSAGPLPWPQCHINGPRSLILFEDLVRAVEVESARAVALAWGVSRTSVWKWRGILKVERANAGVAARWASNISLVIDREQNVAGLAHAHSLQTRLRSEITKAATAKTRQQWTPEQIAQMGVSSDADIAMIVGCAVKTVGQERRRRGIASIGHGGTLRDLQPLDGKRARAQRHELGLTQVQVGTRIGCTSHRISHLENGYSPNVTKATLDKLAIALECAPGDLSGKLRRGE